MAAVIVGIAIVAAAAMPAAAHRADLMSANRAGPILRERTTMAEMRAWFGPPTATRGLRVGCVRVTEARWDRGVTAYVTRTAPRTVVTTFIRKPVVQSDEHGALRMHTRRGLRVGDGEGRLRQLYPSAEPMTHGGHTHYRLGTARSGAFLMAKVIDRSVVRLESWPFELC